MIIPIDRLAKLVDGKLVEMEKAASRTEMVIRAGQACGRDVSLEQVKFGMQITGILVTGIAGATLGVDRPDESSL